VTAAGLLNVYGDNADVIERAKRAACGSGDCNTAMTRMGRTPFAQSFTFQIAPNSHTASNSVEVECKRQFVFVGDYECRAGSEPTRR
jgi:hypothetical protein